MGSVGNTFGVKSGRKARIEAEASRLLAAGVAGQAFPGGVACAVWREGGQTVVAQAAAGKLGAGLGDVDESTPYDLANLTMCFVAVAALRQVVRGSCRLDLVAASVLGDVRGGVGGQATLEQLLTYRAGLAPWGGLYLDVPHDAGSPAARRWILNEASRRPAEHAVPRATYGDLSYLISGELLSRAVGRSLDRLVRAEVLEPLGIVDVVDFPGSLPAEQRALLARNAAPTERCDWRGHVIRGEVHDENCSVLGGVAGHAGLFGTARGVGLFGQAMLDVLGAKSDFLPQGTLIKAIAPRPGGIERMGWLGKDDSVGRRMSKLAFGHFGLTGTSIWCDPERELTVVLLTNRIHPSRANEKIRGFRPGFHDGVLAAFDS